MTVILHALSYLAVIAGFVFGLLSLANGLLYIAEVIEEHAQLAKTVGQRLVYVEILLLALLYAVDGLPLHLVAVGVLAHLVYLQNFSRHWPVISIKSLTFVASCALVLVSHFLSFRYFSDRSASTHSYGRHSAYGGGSGSRGRYAGGSTSHDDSFLDVATYFALCVWLVPFYLFLSLSANDNVLPSAGTSTPLSLDYWDRNFVLADLALPGPALAWPASSAGETPSPSQPSSPSTAQKASFLSPSTSRAPGGAASSAAAVAPDSPSLGRHQRQRSSMMKSALSTAFSIVPASLRPAHLSAHLPLPQGKGRPSASPSPRQDLPQSPNPTYHFQPGVPAGSGASTPLAATAPGLGPGEDYSSSSSATTAFSAAVAAHFNNAAASSLPVGGGASTSAFARGKRPVPLRSVTASPTITTDNLGPASSSSYPAPPHSAGGSGNGFVNSPMNSAFGGPLSSSSPSSSFRSVNGLAGTASSSLPSSSRSQPTSPAQNRFPLPSPSPLSASVGSSAAPPYGFGNAPRGGGGGGGGGATGLVSSLSSQGQGQQQQHQQYTGLGVAIPRRNTVDAGVNGGVSVAVAGAALPVRRPSAMADGIQQRRPVQDPSNR
ncbi:hypothetical protein JCM3774_000587 [Rhodotorula dairenensis]